MIVLEVENMITHKKNRYCSENWDKAHIFLISAGFKSLFTGQKHECYVGINSKNEEISVVLAHFPNISTIKKVEHLI